MITFTKITIVKLKKPGPQKLNDDIRYIGNALGLFGNRDKDSSCFRIFVELLKAARMKEGLSSDQIALRCDLTRGTVVHHLHKLIECGLVRETFHVYYLQHGNLAEIMREIKKQTDTFFDELVEVCEDVDKELEL